MRYIKTYKEYILNESFEKTFGDLYSWYKKKKDKAYVTFSDILKVGINPSYKYGSPVGIYAYPVDRILDDFNKKIQGEKVPIDFAQDRKFAHVLSLVNSTGHINNLSKYTKNDLNKDIKKLKAKFKGDERLIDAAIKTFNNNKTTYPGKDYSFCELWEITRYISLVKAGEIKEEELISGNLDLDNIFSRNSSPIYVTYASIWRKMLMDLGYNSIEDNEGLEIITPGATGFKETVFFKNYKHEESIRNNIDSVKDVKKLEFFEFKLPLIKKFNMPHKDANTITDIINILYFNNSDELYSNGRLRNLVDNIELTKDEIVIKDFIYFSKDYQANKLPPISDLKYLLKKLNKKRIKINGGLGIGYDMFQCNYDLNYDEPGYLEYFGIFSNFDKYHNIYKKIPKPDIALLNNLNIPILDNVHAYDKSKNILNVEPIDIRYDSALVFIDKIIKDSSLKIKVSNKYSPNLELEPLRNLYTSTYDKTFSGIDSNPQKVEKIINAIVSMESEKDLENKLSDLYTTQEYDRKVPMIKNLLKHFTYYDNFFK